MEFWGCIISLHFRPLWWTMRSKKHYQSDCSAGVVWSQLTARPADSQPNIDWCWPWHSSCLCSQIISNKQCLIQFLQLQHMVVHQQWWASWKWPRAGARRRKKKKVHLHTSNVHVLRFDGRKYDRPSCHLNSVRIFFSFHFGTTPVNSSQSPWRLVTTRTRT